jgi:hypothetical protein
VDERIWKNRCSTVPEVRMEPYPEPHQRASGIYDILSIGSILAPRIA